MLSEARANSIAQILLQHLLVSHLLGQCQNQKGKTLDFSMAKNKDLQKRASLFNLP
jgi:hypothetical protein